MRFSYLDLCALVACGGNVSTTANDAGLDTPYSIVDEPIPTFEISPPDVPVCTCSCGVAVDAQSVPCAPCAPCACTNCADFPAAPQSDGTVADPVAMQASFGADKGEAPTGAPCLLEPQDGTMFPYNWLRPRFRWAPMPDQTTFELRIHPPNQTNDLVIYTTNNFYKLPADLWAKLAVDSNDLDISVTLRALGANGVVVGARTKFHIAPVQATGVIVYGVPNDASQANPYLAGFAIGDEIVRPVLQANQVQAMYFDANGNDTPPAAPCIGCHSSTPDPSYVSFNNTNPYPVQMAGVTSTNVGAVPSYVTQQAQTMLAQPWLGIQAMSKAHYQTGDRKLITTYNAEAGYLESDDPTSSSARLAIFDLESTAYDNIAIRPSLWAWGNGVVWTYLPTGETHAIVAPAWSHDGNTIAYTAADENVDGRLGPDLGAGADIKVVPYNNGAGGTAVPLGGASSPTSYEYYPSFSPDDRFIAFNRHPQDPNDPQETKANGGIYSMQRSEIYFTLADGSFRTPIRLNANDPATCAAGVQYVNLAGINNQTTWQPLASYGANTTSHGAGVWNSWARWAPDMPTPTADGRRFYWIVFSSARDAQQVPADYPATSPVSQLYMACIMIDADNNVTSYPAVYIWNQTNMFNAAATDCTGDASATGTDCYVDGSQSTHVTPAWDTIEIPRAILYPPPIN